MSEPIFGSVNSTVNFVNNLHVSTTTN